MPPNRCTVIALTKLSNSSAAISVRGRVYEISRKGCYVSTPSAPRVGTRLSLLISFGEETFETNATVTYVRGGIGMTVAFDESTDEGVLNSWLAGACVFGNATLSLL